METSTTTIRGRTFRTAIALIAAMALAFTLLAPATSEASGQAPGGPVILMGLDSENAPGRAGHGPPEEHAAMVASVLDSVRNGGDGILVIGDGTKVRDYWKGDIAEDPRIDMEVTFVSGAENVKEQSFEGFALIAVASSGYQLSGSTGLTNAENQALIGRDVDIAEFVNAGGGLIGKTQDRLDDPFGYVGPLGEFKPLTSDDGVAQYAAVEVTPAGQELGLTTENMSGWCCWHDVFEDFPDFMEALVIHDDTSTIARRQHVGYVAAVGGNQVTIPTGIDLEPSSATLTVGEEHELVAIVEEDDAPAADVEVTFTVLEGPNEGELGTAITDEHGAARIAYQGSEPGLDVVNATFVDLFERLRTSNEVTVEWLAAPDSLTLAPGEASGTVSDEHTVTATLIDSEGDPTADATISFTVVDGPHAGATGSADTNEDGEASFSYTGEEVGTDLIVATHAPDDGDEVTSNEATMEWAQVLAEAEEAEEDDEEDDEDEVEEIEEADAADAVEAEPDFTG